MRNILLYAFVFLTLHCFGQPNSDSELKFIPIKHASLIIQYKGMNIYIDPADDIEKYKTYPAPDLVFITHTHGDHFNPELLSFICTDSTTVIGNEKAISVLGYGMTMKNREKTVCRGLPVEAVAMYNTTEERLIHHPEGDGNGYIITFGDERVYISGDTEDTQEVRNLKHIDYAFLCMNLPFTMSPEQAASAVINFNPKKVYPYHYSQKEGFADIEKFKQIVNKNSNSEVIFLKWYDTDQ